MSREIWIQRVLTGSNSIRNLAVNVRELGRGMAGKRGDDWIVPGVDGARYAQDKPVGTHTIDLEMIVRPVDMATGVETKTPSEHIEENLDYLMGLFYGRFRVNLRTRTLDVNGDPNPTREALIELGERGLTVTPLGPYSRVVMGTFNMSNPFWRELPLQEDVDIVGTYDNTGNAPIHDAAYTFSGGTDMRLTNNRNGDWIELAGSAGTTVVDLSDLGFTVTGTLGVEALRTRRQRFFRIEPEANDIELTGGGTVTADLYRKWHV